MLISIIIPAISNIQTIASALHRLAEQAGEFEVLVVHRGQPTDGTLSLTAPGVRLVSASCSGYEALLSTGAALAEGELLLFLDVYNRLPPDALLAIERNLKLLPQAIGGNFHLKFDRPSLLVKFLAKMLKRWRYQGCYFRGSGIFIRKNVYETLGGFNTEALMPDYDFVQRMEKHGPTLYLSEVIYLPAPSVRAALTWLLAPALMPSRFTQPLLNLVYAGEYRRANTLLRDLPASSDR